MGYGAINHYQLLAPVARTGRKIVLACETIFEAYVRRPGGRNRVVVTPDGRRFLVIVPIEPGPPPAST